MTMKFVWTVDSLQNNIKTVIGRRIVAETISITIVKTDSQINGRHFKNNRSFEYYRL